MKILLVEDDFVSRRLMQQLLVNVGVCDVAVDGNEALVAFKEAFSCGEPYKLICLDIMMPGMDGHEVLQSIRTFEREHGISVSDPDNATHVIMTTSLEDPQNLLKSVRNGCEGFVPKPIDRERLFRTLRDLGLISE